MSLLIDRREKYIEGERIKLFDKTFKIAKAKNDGNEPKCNNCDYRKKDSYGYNPCGVEKVMLPPPCSIDGGEFVLIRYTLIETLRKL